MPDSTRAACLCRAPDGPDHGTSRPGPRRIVVRPNSSNYFDLEIEDPSDAAPPVAPGSALPLGTLEPLRKCPIFRLRRRGFVFLTLALLFLTVQSLTIQTLLYIAVVTGLGLAQLRTRLSEDEEPSPQSPVEEYGPEPRRTDLPASGRSA